MRVRTPACAGEDEMMEQGTPTPALHVLVARLEALENANRRLRRGGVVAVLLASALVLTGALPSGNTRVAVEAERFVLRDASGRVRAALGLRGDGSPSLKPVERPATAAMAGPC